MPRTLQPGTTARSWRAYSMRDGRKIEREVRSGAKPRCPTCGEAMEARSEGRASPCLVLDATSYDLTCQACRRFWCIIQHTQRSLRLLRMRRLAAAVGAVQPGGGEGSASRTTSLATVPR